MQPSPEIAELMRTFYGRMRAGDAEGANSLISTDPALLFIGSAASGSMTRRRFGADGSIPARG